MFNRRKKNPENVETIVSKDTKIEGKITHETSIRIDGKVIGEIFCKGNVHIGKSGYVENKIQAENIAISGEVQGDLYATEKIHILETGKLSGSVKTAGIVIDEGGIFNGESTITTEAIKKSKKSNINKKQYSNKTAIEK